MVKAHGPASSEPRCPPHVQLLVLCAPAHRHTNILDMHTQRKSSTAVLAFSPLLLPQPQHFYYFGFLILWMAETLRRPGCYRAVSG